jgi:S-adenosylmethionine:tRNA ribosyltransferase-isomerase
LVRLSDFDYELPEELIAQTPLSDRGASRLLHLDLSNSSVNHRQFREVVDLLRSGDVLVLNNTRVNAWRFKGKKPSGGEVEILALKEKPGATFYLGQGLTGKVLEGGEDPIRIVHLECADGNLNDQLRLIGEMPLPPYITEKLHDSERYQTVFSQSNGSAAAPTAGLHFTKDLLKALQEKGIKIAPITLHVGIDTFRPIQVDDVSTHQMHGEVCEITPEVAKIINDAKGRIIAVGTTAVRTLEAFAVAQGKVDHGRKVSRLFITPGFKFQIVNGMFTNFHFPRTTMLLMISALSNRESILQAYAEAVAEKYRFLSFGDSMLLL